MWEQAEKELKERKKNRHRKPRAETMHDIRLKLDQKRMRHEALRKLKEAQEPFKDPETKQTSLEKAQK